MIYKCLLGVPAGAGTDMLPAKFCLYADSGADGACSSDDIIYLDEKTELIMAGASRSCTSSRPVPTFGRTVLTDFLHCASRRR